MLVYMIIANLLFFVINFIVGIYRRKRIDAFTWLISAGVNLLVALFVLTMYLNDN